MNSKTTIVGLVAAIAVLSGAMGLSVTGAFSDLKVAQSTSSATGFLMGQVIIEAYNENGELIAYRMGDNEVVDGGEQCILKMLFASTGGSGNAGAQTDGRGEYASTSLDGVGDCTGILTGAWDVIAIGTGDTAISGIPAWDLLSGLETECSAQLAGDGAGDDDCPVSIGLNRAVATTKSWTNGTSDTLTQIEIKKTFTSTGTAEIRESGLFNSTTIATGGMLSHRTFAPVSLTSGDSITVTWTFKVGN